jgi:hypothetical protein
MRIGLFSALCRRIAIVSDTWYEAIAARYAFSIPDAYRRLESRGLFNWPSSDPACIEPGSYLWLPEMEWLRPREILEYKFEDYHLPGFVPFAFTGAHDPWCWRPDLADERGTPVVYCPHDEYNASIYAPDFATALYRQILAFCGEPWYLREDYDVSALLRRWAIDLAEIFVPPRCETLHALADDPARIERARSIDNTEVAFESMGDDIAWVRPYQAPPAD